MKLHFTNDWLRKKIQSDPDIPCEAGDPKADIFSRPACPYCGLLDDVRVWNHGDPELQDFICEDCFSPSDTGPCFDDLPKP